jgi:hypothetical protein
MNRRSPTSSANPCPTGAACALTTVGTNTGLIVETNIATIVAIDHRFLERIPRHVRGFKALMIGSSFHWRLRIGWNARGFWYFASGPFSLRSFNSSVLSLTNCRGTVDVLVNGDESGVREAHLS